MLAEMLDVDDSSPLNVVRWACSWKKSTSHFNNKKIVRMKWSF